MRRNIAVISAGHGEDGGKINYENGNFIIHFKELFASNLDINNSKTYFAEELEFMIFVAVKSPWFVKADVRKSSLIGWLNCF